MGRPGGRALAGAAMALLALIAIGGGPAGGAPGQRERARDGRIAYTVVIDRGDCGRVLDCVDSRVRVADVRRARGRRRALTIGGCPSRDCDDRAPAWSPDGRTLIFNRIQDTGGMSIATGVHGRRQREVRGGTEPAFSPSGRRIAYEAPARVPGGFDRSYPSGRSTPMEGSAGGPSGAASGRPGPRGGGSPSRACAATRPMTSSRSIPIAGAPRA